MQNNTLLFPGFHLQTFRRKPRSAQQRWAGDITYLYTTEGWLYLTVIIDLNSRSVIGWSMNTHMTAGLVCDALQMVLWRRGFPIDVIVHSDQGSQFAQEHIGRSLIPISFNRVRASKGTAGITHAALRVSFIRSR
jgi:transposase InsO family protein